MAERSWAAAGRGNAAAWVIAAWLLAGLLVPCKAGCQQAGAGGRYVSPYGGVHEFGVWVGYSPVSGPLWGYDENVRELAVDLRYSLLIRGGTKWNLRFAPEVTTLANLIELAPSLTNPGAADPYAGRRIEPGGVPAGIPAGNEGAAVR